MADNHAPHATRAYAGLTAETWYDDLEYCAPCMRCEHPAVRPEDLQEVDDRDALVRAIARERGHAYTREDLLRDLELERAEALERGEKPCGLACRLVLVRYAREAWADARAIVAHLGEAVQAARDGRFEDAVAIAQQAASWEREWGDSPTSALILRAIQEDWRSTQKRKGDRPKEG